MGGVGVRQVAIRIWGWGHTIYTAAPHHCFSLQPSTRNPLGPSTSCKRQGGRGEREDSSCIGSIATEGKCHSCLPPRLPSALHHGPSLAPTLYCPQSIQQSQDYLACKIDAMTNSINLAADQRMADADLTSFNEAMTAIQQEVGLSRVPGRMSVRVVWCLQVSIHTSRPSSPAACTPESAPPPPLHPRSKASAAARTASTSRR